MANGDSISDLVKIIASKAPLLDQQQTPGKNENIKDEAARHEVIEAATALISTLENPLEFLIRVGWGEPSRTACLRIALNLNLLDKLDPTIPKTSAQLAEGTKASPDLVSRIIRTLAAFRIVKEHDHDQYLATPHIMAMRAPEYAGDLCVYRTLTPALNTLPEFMAKTDYQVPKDDQNGPLPYALGTNQNFFGILQSDQRMREDFNKFMTIYGKSRSLWVDLYPCREKLLHGADPSVGPILVDVGGGLGSNLLAFYNKFIGTDTNTDTDTDTNGQNAKFPPTGRLVLQDLPSTIEHLNSKSKPANQPELPPTIETVAHDFFTPQPPEYRHARAYFMQSILRDWPDHKCHLILSHLRDAMKPGGYSKLLIEQFILPDTGATWQQTSHDITMMAILVAQERTLGDFSRLLDAAGLKIVNVYSKDPKNASLIEAVVKDD